jgi:hypothetical protein
VNCAKNYEAAKGKKAPELCQKGSGGGDDSDGVETTGVTKGRGNNVLGTSVGVIASIIFLTVGGVLGAVFYKRRQLKILSVENRAQVLLDDYRKNIMKSFESDLDKIVKEYVNFESEQEKIVEYVMDIVKNSKTDTTITKDERAQITKILKDTPLKTGAVVDQMVKKLNEKISTNVTDEKGGMKIREIINYIGEIKNDLKIIRDAVSFVPADLISPETYAALEETSFAIGTPTPTPTIVEIIQTGDAVNVLSQKITSDLNKSTEVVQEGTAPKPGYFENIVRMSVRAFTSDDTPDKKGSSEGSSEGSPKGSSEGSPKGSSEGSFKSSFEGV